MKLQKLLIFSDLNRIDENLLYCQKIIINLMTFFVSKYAMKCLEFSIFDISYHYIDNFFLNSKVKIEM